MELILWRHADAEDGADDLARKLTAKGEKQAARVAKWLRDHLPNEYTVLASPAVRAQATAKALGVAVNTAKELAPGASPAAIIKAAGWPGRDDTVIIVGHQPDLGRAVAQLVAHSRAEWSIRKGGLWWLAAEEPVRVRAVISPDLL